MQGAPVQKHDVEALVASAPFVDRNGRGGAALAPPPESSRKMLFKDSQTFRPRAGRLLVLPLHFRNTVRKSIVKAQLPIAPTPAYGESNPSSNANLWGLG